MSHGTQPEPVQHINTDHLDELLAVARAFGGYADVTSARAEGVDPEGIDLAMETRRGPATARVEFAERVVDYPDGLRVAFVRLTKRARAALA